MRRLAVALVVLAACGSPWEGEGTVVELRYDDPDVIVVPGHMTPTQQVCSGYGTTRTCTMVPGVWVPGYSYVDPAHYTLIVEDDKGKHNAGVSPETFNNCKIGQRYSTAEQTCTSR